MIWIIYLASVVGNIQWVAIGAAVTCGAAAAVAMMAGAIEGIPKLRESAIKGAVAAFAIGFVAAMIPSATTIYMMVGANIAEAQITSPENQQVISKVRALVMQKLDEAIAEPGK